MTLIHSDGATYPHVCAWSKPCARSWSTHQGDVAARGGMRVSRQVLRAPRASASHWGGASRWSKRGCVHCPHFGLRIGSNEARIGPDSACFRGSPLFAEPGMQFESHLGHVFSLLRGFLASGCVQNSFYGPLRGPIFVGGGCSGGSFSGLDSGVAVYFFMAVSVRSCMAC